MIDIDLIPKYVRIENRKNFLLDNIPNYFPGTARHVTFWKEQVRRCIEGHWVEDNGGWRYMPGPLYFYVNFHTIHHNLEDDNGPKVPMRPLLRDIEWEYFYNYTLCLGFSGFEDDDNVSCHHSLVSDDPLHKSVFKGDVAKKYEDPAKYIRKLHDKPLGKPLYFNRKKNLFLLASRGLGKSYLVSGTLLHMFLFDGRRNITEQKRKADMFVGSALSDKVTDLMEKFVYSYENLPGAYMSTDTYIPSPLYKLSEGKITSPKGMLVSRYQKKVNNKWVTVGTGTTIKRGTWTVENPDAATGGRYAILIAEEIGLLGNAIAVHGQNEATQREGNIKIGVSIYIGTGGNIDKIIESETIFRDPDKFEVLAFDDEYEQSGKIGWFIPYYYCINSAKDENGNTDLEKAIKIVETERKIKKSGTNGARTIDRYVLSYPIVPSEMFLSKNNTFFPVYEIRERLKILKHDNLYQRLAKPVVLGFDKDSPNGVKATIDYSKKPLLEFRRYHEYDDVEGCPVIYEFPIADNSGKIRQGMYIFGLDHYHSDEQENGGSLGSFWVLKTYKYGPIGLGFSEIVAEYTGKPYAGKNAFNENVEKLIMMYGGDLGSLYFENTKGNTMEYFSKRNKMGYLARRPKTVLSATFRGVDSAITVNYGYELQNRTIKVEALSYLRDWLIEEREIEGQKLRNLDLIPSRGLLEELAAFDFDNGNFDRVMGFTGAIIGLREQHNELVKQDAKSTLTAASFFANNRVIFKGKANEFSIGTQQDQR